MTHWSPGKLDIIAIKYTELDIILHKLDTADTLDNLGKKSYDTMDSRNKRTLIRQI